MNSLQDDRAPNSAAPTGSLAGRLLMVFGGLIATLSGLCTGGVAIIFLPESPTPGLMSSLIGSMMIFGGLPLLVGILLFVAGRNMLRRSRESESGPPPSGPA